MSALPPPLVSLIAQFEAATAEARALAQGTSDEVFSARGDGARWSAADCLAHLSTTNERYLRKLDRLLAGVEPSRREPRYRHSLVGRWFRWTLEPPIRKKLRAPKIFVPPPDALPREAVLAEFESIQARIADAIRKAAPHDFAGVTMTSPVTRLLKLNLWDAFQAMAAHERRHLWQARRAIEQARSQA